MQQDDVFDAAAVASLAHQANLKELDFKSTQGAGETRIAAAAGVPPVIVGRATLAMVVSSTCMMVASMIDSVIKPL